MSLETVTAEPLEGARDLLDCLARLDNEFERRAEFWRNTTDDPHGIAAAVMVAMEESKLAIQAVIKEVIAQQSGIREIEDTK